MIREMPDELVRSDSPSVRFRAVSSARPHPVAPTVSATQPIPVSSIMWPPVRCEKTRREAYWRQQLLLRLRRIETYKLSRRLGRTAPKERPRDPRYLTT